MSFVIVSFILMCFKIWGRIQCWTESKAALKSTYIACSGVLFDLDNLMVSKYVVMADEVSCALLKPHCSCGMI